MDRLDVLEPFCQNTLLTEVAFVEGCFVHCVCYVRVLLRVHMCVQVDLHVSLQFVIDQVLPFLVSLLSIGREP